ncbi:hypothetical protein EJB05_35218 [Eragrostis curvula]|uniref:Uncharacterized protein n=1 Tax=Eragrostis curvula TaxID=38414 RepID=A0A5J9U678_9POAL|nr:hypothetical protein EJB05_35218 [Eragrostis curvula]
MAWSTCIQGPALTLLQTTMDRIEPTMSRLAAISCVTSTGNQPWVMASYLMCNHDRLVDAGYGSSEASCRLLENF